MKQILLTLTLTFCFFTLYPQSSSDTEKVTINYANGLEVFNVLKVNEHSNFDDTKEYYWYTEFSKIKSTKGGNGGKLLDSNYKFYDEKGNLILSQNFESGLKHGESKKWSAEGELIEIVKYDKGEVVYWKYHPEDDEGWVEQIGRMLHEGWIKNSYDKFNNLLASQETFVDEESVVKKEKKKTIIYYENSGQKEEEYTAYMLLDNLYIGEYTHYFENGNRKVVGNFFDPYDIGIDKYVGNIRDGEWKWYDENGDLEAIEKYRAVVEYWGDGNIKSIYGQYLDELEDKWINHGRFYSYEEEGDGIGEKKEYEFGELLVKEK